MSKIKKQRFEGVFWVTNGKNHLATLNLISGKSYSEKIIKVNKAEYREWNPYKSKPATAILKGMKEFPVKIGSKILYLGIAQGKTASYFSDIIGKEGVIYGVEISSRAIRELIPVSEKRGNIIPICADARKPEEYSWIEKVDLIYEDVADREQVEILIRNAKKFLKPGGFGMIAIKSRSIDVTKRPKEIFKEQGKKLEKSFEVLEEINLEPYEKDHCLFLLRFKC